MSVRHPQINCVRQPGLSKLLSGIEDKKSILHLAVSAEQWSGGGLKQNPDDSPEEMVEFS